MDLISYSKNTEAILGDDAGHVRAIRFTDGLEIPAQLVVMAVGIRPNTALAESAGLHCHRGIVVNDTMQTYDPRIYAVGECVSHRGTVCMVWWLPCSKWPKCAPITLPILVLVATKDH